MRLRWRDERLAFNSSTCGLESIVLTSATGLWVPDVYFEHSVSIKLGDGHDGEVVYIYPDGSVVWSRFARLQMRCSMGFGQLPFDTQDCLFLSGIWSDTAADVTLTWHDPAAPLGSYIDSFDTVAGEWRVVDVRGEDVRHVPPPMSPNLVEPCFVVSGARRLRCGQLLVHQGVHQARAALRHVHYAASPRLPHRAAQLFGLVDQPCCCAWPHRPRHHLYSHCSQQLPERPKVIAQRRIQRLPDGLPAWCSGIQRYRLRILCAPPLTDMPPFCVSYACQASPRPLALRQIRLPTSQCWSTLRSSRFAKQVPPLTTTPMACSTGVSCAEP